MPTRPKSINLAPPGATGRTPAQQAAKKFYDSARWRALRKQVLAEEPTCRFCPPEHPRLSTTGHHVEPLDRRPDLALVRENIRGICTECHTALHKGGTLAGGLFIPADPKA